MPEFMGLANQKGFGNRARSGFLSVVPTSPATVPRTSSIVAEFMNRSVAVLDYSSIQTATRFCQSVAGLLCHNAAPENGSREGDHSSLAKFKNSMSCQRQSLTRRCVYIILSTSLFLCGCASPVNLPDNSLPQTRTTPMPVNGKHVTLIRRGPNQFEIQLKGIQSVAAKQRQFNWCWAACAEMLYRYYGANVSQEEIVEFMGKQTKPGENPQAAGELEMCLAMNPDLILEMARREKVQRESHRYAVSFTLNNLDQIYGNSSISSDVIVREISSGNPLVMGLHGGEWQDGHIVLVYGAEYSRFNTEGKQAIIHHIRYFAIHKAFAIDPQPEDGKSQLIELNGMNLKDHMDFIIGKEEARKKVVTYLKSFMTMPDEIQRK